MKKLLLALLLCCTLLSHATAGVVMPVWMLNLGDNPAMAMVDNVAMAEDCPHHRQQNHNAEQAQTTAPSPVAPCCIDPDNAAMTSPCENCACTGVTGLMAWASTALFLNLPPAAPAPAAVITLLSRPLPQLLRPPRH